MRIALLGTAAAVLAVVACSSSPEIPNDLPTGRPMRGSAPTKTSADAGSATKGGESEAENEGTPPPPPRDAGSTTPTPTPTTDAGTGGTGGACSGEASRQSCYHCCETTNPGALDVLDQAFGTCVCAATICGNECGSTFCNGIEPAAGSLCDQCIGTYYGTCDDYAVAQCQKNATCAKMLACDTTSGCAAKPAP